MPGLLERIAANRSPAVQRNGFPGLGFQNWVDFFSYGGTTYPLLRTSMQPLDEEQLASTATAAYHSNGPVFALVVARLQVFSQARFQWTRFQGGVPSDLFGTQALKVLERPWRGGTTADLLARMEVDVSLAGNAYIRKTTPTRLNRLRPDWVTVILGSNEDADHPGEAGDVEVAGYLYKPGGYQGRSRPVVLTPEECAHFAPLPDPDFNFLGQSWITPLIRDVQADGAMTEHKRAFMANAATPNLVIKFDPSIDIEQVREFKEVFEEDHTGTWNAYKTLFLGGGADPVTVGRDFQQLDFAATQGKGESRLAAAAGVPPSWVGFSEGLQGSALNAGNFTSARRRFADGTMQHLWVNAAASLEVIVPDPGNAPGASLWFDTRSVSFLREDAGDLAKIQADEAATIGGLIKDGFTPDSAVDAVKNHDWSRLEHTGLVSVQLQEPGAGSQPSSNGQANGQANGQVPAVAASQESRHSPFEISRFNKHHGADGKFSGGSGGGGGGAPTSGGGGGGSGGGGSAREIGDNAQGRQYIKNTYGGWHKGLSAREGKALGFYQSPGFELMNGQLRGHTVKASPADLKRARDANRDLAVAIKKAPPLTEALTVHRGFSASQFDLKPGSKITDKGFVSTSLTREGVAAVAQGGPPAVARITLPKGTRAGAGYTRELILPPGSSFRVTSVTKKGKTTQVEMELIP